MLTRKDQATLQPLVNAKWLEHCSSSGCSPADKQARDAWYREGLWQAAGVHSSRELEPGTEPWSKVLAWFAPSHCEAVAIETWSDKQNAALNSLATRAWRCELQAGRPVTLQAFVSEICMQACGGPCPDRKEGFEALMGALAVVANDERWIDRVSQGAERRMRWQLLRYLGDLSWLEGTVYGWKYVGAIYSQARLWPSLDEAPADELLKALQMLDTHIRRRCRERNLEPRDLPSRGKVKHEIRIVHGEPPYPDAPPAEPPLPF